MDVFLRIVSQGDNPFGCCSECGRALNWVAGRVGPGEYAQVVRCVECGKVYAGSAIAEDISWLKHHLEIFGQHPPTSSKNSKAKAGTKVWNS
jgi:NAD-dependent SIR2 family protein deacetylase